MDDSIEQRESGRKREEVRGRDHEEQANSGGLGGRHGTLAEKLHAHDYPTTTDDLVRAYGDYEIETQQETASLKEVLVPTKN